MNQVHASMERKFVFAMPKVYTTSIVETQQTYCSSSALDFAPCQDIWCSKEAYMFSTMNKKKDTYMVQV